MPITPSPSFNRKRHFGFMAHPGTSIKPATPSTVSTLRLACLRHEEHHHPNNHNLFILNKIIYNLEGSPPCLPGRKLFAHPDRVGQFVFITFSVPKHKRVLTDLDKTEVYQALADLIKEVFDGDTYCLGFNLFFEKAPTSGYHFHCILSRFRFHKEDHNIALAFQTSDNQANDVRYLLRGPHIQHDENTFHKALKTRWVSILKKVLKVKPKRREQALHISTKDSVQNHQDRLRVFSYKGETGKFYRRLQLFTLRKDNMVVGRLYKKRVGWGVPEPFLCPLPDFIQSYVLDFYRCHLRTQPRGFLHGGCLFSGVMDWISQPQPDFTETTHHIYMDQPVERLERLGLAATKPIVAEPIPIIKTRLLPPSSPRQIIKRLSTWPTAKLCFFVPAGWWSASDGHDQYTDLCQRIDRLLKKQLVRGDRQIGYVIRPGLGRSHKALSGLFVRVYLSLPCYRRVDADLVNLFLDRHVKDKDGALGFFRFGIISDLELNYRLFLIEQAWREAFADGHIPADLPMVCRDHMSDTQTPHDAKIEKRLYRSLRKAYAGARGYLSNRSHIFGQLTRVAMDQHLLSNAHWPRHARQAYEKFLKHTRIVPPDTAQQPITYTPLDILGFGGWSNKQSGSRSQMTIDGQGPQTHTFVDRRVA